MAQIMLDERKRLGLEAYDLHALRYRGVMELAWSKCDDDEIASYSGHSSKDMILNVCRNRSPANAGKSGKRQRR
jgi:hypothetical protein